MICLSTFIWDHATRSFNRSPEYYCALTMITLLIVMRKLKVDNISESRTWILRFDGEYFLRAGSTKFGHRYTLGMGSYKNKALTTGCNEGSSCGAKTELMNMETFQWSNGPDFPFGSWVNKWYYSLTLSLKIYYYTQASLLLLNCCYWWSSIHHRRLSRFNLLPNNCRIQERPVEKTG